MNFPTDEQLDAEIRTRWSQIDALEKASKFIPHDRVIAASLTQTLAVRRLTVAVERAARAQDRLSNVATAAAVVGVFIALVQLFVAVAF
jgi:uncharacterized membrane protein